MTEKRKKIITQDGPSALQNVTHNPKESSHLVLLVLRKLKRRERSSKMQKTCPQKSPVIISANNVCECFQLKRKINQFETAEV